MNALTPIAREKRHDDDEAKVREARAALEGAETAARQAASEVDAARAALERARDAHMADPKAWTKNVEPLELELSRLEAMARWKRAVVAKATRALELATANANAAALAILAPQVTAQAFDELVAEDVLEVAELSDRLAAIRARLSTKARVFHAMATRATELGATDALDLRASSRETNISGFGALEALVARALHLSQRTIAELAHARGETPPPPGDPNFMRLGAWVQPREAPAVGFSQGFAWPWESEPTAAFFSAVVERLAPVTFNNEPPTAAE
ncbi:MAG: hypothetical protein IPG50_21735 [Myxococcales bacterium]|nr:hypothetical protein [Myxococcales bacterium]